MWPRLPPTRRGDTPRRRCRPDRLFVTTRAPTGSGLIDQVYQSIVCPGGSCYRDQWHAGDGDGAECHVRHRLRATARRDNHGDGDKCRDAGARAVRLLAGLHERRVICGVDIHQRAGRIRLAGLAGGLVLRADVRAVGIGPHQSTVPEHRMPGGSCPVTSGTPVTVTAPNATSGIDFALPARRDNHGDGDKRRDAGARAVRLGVCVHEHRVLCGIDFHQRAGGIRLAGLADGLVPRADVRAVGIGPHQSTVPEHRVPRRLLPRHQRHAGDGDGAERHVRHRLCAAARGCVPGSSRSAGTSRFGSVAVTTTATRTTRDR